MANLKVTLVKSTIGAVPKHKKTVEALGLKKLNKTVVLPDNAAILVRSFIMKQSGVFHGTINDVDRTFHITLLVGIFNTEDKISVLVFCNKICIEC